VCTGWLRCARLAFGLLRAATFTRRAGEIAARIPGREQAEGPVAGGDGALGVVRVDQPLATVNGPALPVTPLTVTVTQIWFGLAAGAAPFRTRML